MEIDNIITDAFKYPIENVKSLLIYLVLSLVAGMGLFIVGIGIGIGNVTNNTVLSVIISCIGLIVTALILLLLQGYVLDVVKIAINKENTAPEIDFVRQIKNGLKLLVASIIYIGIPILLLAILMNINKYLIIIGLIIYIIALFAMLMAQCRLAKTDSLTEALNVKECLMDISRIGVVKVIAVIIILAIVVIIVSLICSFIQGYSQTIGVLLNSVFTLFMAFVQARAYGLMYSSIEGA